MSVGSNKVEAPSGLYETQGTSVQQWSEEPGSRLAIESIVLDGFSDNGQRAVDNRCRCLMSGVWCCGELLDDC